METESIVFATVLLLCGVVIRCKCELLSPSGGKYQKMIGECSVSVPSQQPVTEHGHVTRVSQYRM